MPAHKTNPLLKVAIVAVVVSIIISLLVTHHSRQTPTVKDSTVPQTSLDSAAEALNTLTTEIAQTKQQMQAVVKANEALQRDNAQLQKQNSMPSVPIKPVSTEPEIPPAAHGEPLTVIKDLTPAEKPIETASNTEPAKPVPYYTIPANATSVHDRLMTALVGRMPVKGVVTDPYPFKLVVSDDTLAANGLRVPHLTQMIVSGYSEGDLNLLSVRGWVTSLTFVFDDGTITSTTSNDNNIGKFTKDNALGYLSDAYGNPFTRGQLISNAPAYLGGNVALGAAAGAANTYSQAQVSNQTGIAGAMNSSVTGSIGKYVEGQAMNNAANQVQQWWLDREQQSFDLLSLLLSLDLSACNSIGNVVPQKGASMEQVYDGMGKPKNVPHVAKSTPPATPVAATPAGFHPAPNPMLHLYVYPHLIGGMPVSGYETEFSAYEKETLVGGV